MLLPAGHWCHRCGGTLGIEPQLGRDRDLVCLQCGYRRELPPPTPIQSKRRVLVAVAS